MKYRFIAIEGNIGAGKTTLAKILAEKLRARLILEEFAHNALLPAFYADPTTHAFPLELSFLTDRCEQFRALPQENEEIIISDYLIEKSLVFAQNNLKDDEFVLFSRMYLQMTRSLPKPDLVIFLSSSVDHLQQNIRQRGRTFEQGISYDYLNKINELYQAHLETLTIPVWMMDSQSFNDINNQNTIDSLLNDLQ